MTSLPKQFYYKKNRLQQLRGFYHTQELGSVSKAAKHMSLSQSTVTLQIQTLERDVKTQLFDRNKKQLTLTPDGKILYDLTIPLLQGIDGVYERFLTEKSKKKEQRIDIAAHHIGISYLLPEFLRQYTEKYPDVKIMIRNISRSDAMQRLKNGDIDLMLYPIVETPIELKWRKSFTYDPVLLMSPEHPLAKVDTLTLEEIGKHKLIRIDRDLITLPIFEEVVKQYGWHSNIEFEQGNWEILKHFVRAKLGLAVVSTICVDKKDSTLIAKSLGQFFPQMSYGVMIKDGRHIHQPLRNFIDIVDPQFFSN
jgi:DNA-binding transcriptional LysR family regulator